MSWDKVSLSEVCSIQIGKTPARKENRYWVDNGTPWASIADLSADSSLSKTKETISEEAVRETNIKLVPAGTVVMSFKLSIGKVGIVSREMYTNEAIAAFLIEDAGRLDRNYLAHALKNIDFENIGDRAAKGKTLNKRTLSLLQIPLPPLAEQKRIAAILDQADALRHKRQQALDHLNQLGQSIFYEMFGRTREQRPITSYIESIETGKNLVGADQDQSVGYKVLKISAVNRGGFRRNEIKSLPTDYIPPAHHLVSDGDLLFSRANTRELVGLSAIVKNPHPRSALPDKLWRLVPKHADSIEFLNAAILNPHVRRQIEKLCSGTSGSMKNISKAKFKKITLPAVDAGEVKAFSERMRGVVNSVSIHTDAFDLTNCLFSSLQQRAFRGEL